MKKLAIRNIRLCTKDCLCLYVCPTGATDTENSIIDANKCIGCGACAEACPSKAISLVPLQYPVQQAKANDVVSVSNKLSKSKSKQEEIAQAINEGTTSDGLYRLMMAFQKSNRLMNEDILRESGYMLPQSNNAHKLLKNLLDNKAYNDLPVDAINKIIELIPCNEKEKN